MLNFNILNNFFFEFSLINFYFDVFFLQFILIYILYLFISASNIYYNLIYLFLQICYFGLVLSLFQMELFTGFLWVTELTILFIFLILCFYLNSEGTIQKNETFYVTYFYFIIVIFFFNNFFSIELKELNIYNFVDLWDDYYESLDNSLMTDFFGLFLVYYEFNSLFTFLIFFLLFIGSIVCVVLSKLSYLNKKKNVGNYLSLFNFFLSSLSFFFYRKQNLSKQTLSTSSTKIFKKK